MKKIGLNLNQSTTLSECFEEYIIHCKVRNLSSKTLETYRVHFSVLKKHLDKIECEIGEINSTVVGSFILYLRERGCNDITVQSYIRDVRTFLYFCMEKEWIVPKFRIRLPKADKKIKETYTDAELRILLKKPNLKTARFTEYRTWVYSNYLLATGNRISSALDIKIQDLDFENRLIQMNKSKNRTAQIIPMSDSLALVLKEYLNYRKGSDSDYLFCTIYGKKAKLRSYQDMLTKYNESRGVMKTSSHLYRHTFAKKWILNGGDIFRLQKLLGHSDLSVVKEYVNMFSSDLSLNYSQFNPLDTMDINQNQTKISMKSKGKR